MYKWIKSLSQELKYVTINQRDQTYGLETTRFIELEKCKINKWITELNFFKWKKSIKFSAKSKMQKKKEIEMRKNTIGNLKIHRRQSCLRRLQFSWWNTSKYNLYRVLK